MLIAFEGIDGTGKSTLAARLAARLRAGGREVVETREPWTSPAGTRLRELLGRSDRTTSGSEELELFHADRAAHVAAVVRPALARGAVVVQDRTFWSTAAYQGARGVPVPEILARSLAIAPRPALTILLELEPAVALERIARSRAGRSSFERLEDLRAVARIYADLAAREPSIVRIDAGRPLAEVESDVVAEAEKALRARSGARGGALNEPA
jgi:dTMP kinase